jgi:hypothetical protein
MAGLLPAAVFGLEVPNGDVMIPAVRPLVMLEKFILTDYC